MKTNLKCVYNKQDLSIIISKVAIKVYLPLTINTQIDSNIVYRVWGPDVEYITRGFNLKIQFLRPQNGLQIGLG